MTLNDGQKAASASKPLSSSSSSPLEPVAPSQELATLLPQVVQMVQAFVEEGEKPGSNVTAWQSIPQLRQNVSLDLPDYGSVKDGDKKLLDSIQLVLENSVNPWTGRFLDKLYSANTPVGVCADLILSVLNANAHVMSASPMLSLAEEKCVEGLCEMFGFNDTPDGLTMPGGSSANTLAVQTALANIFPPFREQGLLGISELLFEKYGRVGKAARPLIFTSDQSHYSLDKAAISAGLGLSSVIKVPCDHTGRMDPAALSRLINDSISEGLGTPFFVNATSGSTVLGSFDDLRSISAIARRHGCWLHVDGSWGGPIIFSPTRAHSSLMDGSELADSITINPHKLLNVPLQCSFLLVRRGKALSANTLDAGYLFHSKDARENAAMKTMGCGRRGDALKFWLYWVRFGKEGLGKHVDAGLRLANDVVEAIRDEPRLELGPLAEPLFLQVCFRPKPPRDHKGVEPPSVEVRSKATRYVHNVLKERRRFAVDFAPLPGGIGDFIRLVVHPRTKREDLEELIEEVASIGEEFWERSEESF
ncbi:PLP-dependent transferase [Violaceomyces palustris]|uniref:PLP-dependent transferase n=1 Tax=Violaceomyces palustris TaxID=1673888 RepID=A0ACD0NUI8_9BASI|nr:PLP-dependent transferase [Violaceomyces palustris]